MGTYAIEVKDFDRSSLLNEGDRQAGAFEVTPEMIEASRKALSESGLLENGQFAVLLDDVTVREIYLVTERARSAIGPRTGQGHAPERRMTP